MKRKVTVERNTLRFSAAHFATFAGDCEPLHGHNYEVLVEVEGDLTEDSWVYDFIELKRLVQRLCKPLDHRFILQRDSKVLAITENADAWEIAFQDRQYSFPKGDVCALPIDNSTAERIAEWLCQQINDELSVAGARNITAITVGIEEAPGQAGWYTVQV